ncbi:MAG TPA: macro domain-containing protein [Kofleriaceae bacterium]|jgi:O-acetyl-ADP-ribose deacetylase (regulator of RNase III)|nr:macro domain-containing protein [Kofleriaceae bacterium]
MQVHVARAELTTLPVDAVVNPANSLGIMGGGTSGVLRRAGGDIIQQEAMSAAPIAVGAAIVTGAGSLPCKFVIHAPTMEEPGMKIPAENVRRAARAALIAADVKQFKVIAFPGMGTDLGDVPADEAARAIVEEIRAHKRACPETIYLVDPSIDMVDAFEEALRNAVQNL